MRILFGFESHHCFLGKVFFLLCEKARISHWVAFCPNGGGGGGGENVIDILKLWYVIFVVHCAIKL